METVEGETSDASPVDASPVEPTWLDKMRRACGLRRFDVVARIALSLKDTETAMELVQALAFECLKYQAFFLKAVLREFRLQNVAPELAVELFWKTELWFRAQGPKVHEWNEVVYAFVLANHYEEAWDLVTSMEDASEMPAPSAATYGILLLPMATQQGPRAANEILARQRLKGNPNPLHHLIMAMFYVQEKNLGIAKAHVRQGERLIRQLRATLEHYPEKRQFHPLTTYLYATLMAGYRRLGCVQDCFTIFGVVQQHAVQPSAIVFAILQQACWGHLDATGEVRQILRLMEDMNVQPETSNYNALIRTYSDSGQFTNALQVANRLREAGVAWNEFTYTYLLFAAVNAGQVELGVRLLSQMRSDGVRPSSKQYITVFLGLAKSGYYEDAIRVFERLVSLGSCGTEAFNVMIGIHCERGSMTAAMTTMERMKEAGMGPDVRSWQILLTGYAFEGQYDKILELQEAFTSFRKNLQAAAQNVSVTSVARQVAKSQLQRQRQWTKVYDILIDAALWNGEWSRAVALLKDVVDLGFPVDLVKHRRLVQDLKEFYGGKDAAIGIAAEVIAADKELPDPTTTGREWLAKVSASSRYADSSGTMVASKAAMVDYMSLQAFAASFSPHWLDGVRSGATTALPELCKEMLLSAESSETLDASAAYEILHVYYHATVHRRAVVPLKLDRGQHLHLRSNALETVSTLRELFDLNGWPTGQLESPRYVFLRPNAFALDAFLLLLGLASSYPHSILFLREADLADLAPETPTEASGLPVTKQSLQRQWSRALTVTIGATMRTFPAALLLNSRTMLATGDLNLSSSDFERKLRDALAGRDPSSVEEEFVPNKEDQATEAWSAWLQRQGLSRLLRHDSRGALRSDGVTTKAARLEIQNFRLKGMADGQVDVDL